MTVASSNVRLNEGIEKETRLWKAEYMAKAWKAGHIAVAGTVAYYTIWIYAVFLLFLDVNLGNYEVVKNLGNVPQGWQWDPRLGYVLIGGALGSILYSIRMLHFYYIKEEWNNRWLGKYVTAPLEGSVMAVVVYVLLQGSIVMIGLHSGDYQTTTVNTMTPFGISLLVGFSMRNVVKWLEEKAANIFKVEETEEDQNNTEDTQSGETGLAPA